MKSKYSFRSASLCLSIIFVLSLFYTNLLKAAHTSPNTIFLTNTVTETYCGGCVGAIDLMVSGGTMPYEYAWSNGATSEDLSDLCLSAYNVTVTDAGGCTATSSIFVGQNNYPHVELLSQQDVDEYVSNFSFCNEVTGVLQIGSNATNSNISDLSGLSFINTVGSNIIIVNNPNLDNLNGLQNINSVGNSIILIGNNSINTIEDFPPVSNINGNLILDFLSSLNNLNGLENLNSIDGHFYLSSANNLLSIAALSNLQTVGDYLDIRICTSLVNLNGLQNLTSIGSDFTLRDNFSLTDINALDHPISIGGELTIENTNLSVCHVEAICNFLGNNASNATISNNVFGCNNPEEVISECVFQTFNITVVESTPTCAGECDGSLSVEITGGVPPYVIEWSTGDTSTTIENLCSDLYTLFITDNSGQQTIAVNFFLPEPDPIQSSANTTPVCFGSCNGSVDIIVTGGTPPYDFGNFSSTDLCAGTYEVTITDSNNCTHLTSFEILEGEDFDFMLDGITAAIPGQNNGAINITVTSGTAPFTFEWSTNGNVVSEAEDPDDLYGGTYFVVVTDIVGCSQEFGPFEVGGFTSTTDFDKRDFDLFPNPTGGLFEIRFTEAIPNHYNIELQSNDGKIVRPEVLQQNSDFSIIDISGYSNGVYFLRVNSDDFIIITKIIKL